MALSASEKTLNKGAHNIYPGILKEYLFNGIQFYPQITPLLKIYIKYKYIKLKFKYIILYICCGCLKCYHKWGCDTAEETWPGDSESLYGILSSAHNFKNIS